MKTVEWAGLYSIRINRGQYAFEYPCINFQTFSITRLSSPQLYFKIWEYVCVPAGKIKENQCKISWNTALYIIQNRFHSFISFLYTKNWRLGYDFSEDFETSTLLIRIVRFLRIRHSLFSFPNTFEYTPVNPYMVVLIKSRKWKTLISWGT